MHVIHNKLISDNRISIIIKEDCFSEYHVLNADECRENLILKLYDEASEAGESSIKNALISKIGDGLEVLEAFFEFYELVSNKLKTNKSKKSLKMVNLKIVIFYII